MGYDPNGAIGENVILGFACALLCCVGWGCRSGNLRIWDERSLCQQCGCADNPPDCIGSLLRRNHNFLMGGWKFTAGIAVTKATMIILVAALFGTASYLCYYSAINKIGATKAMALNIN